MMRFIRQAAAGLVFASLASNGLAADQDSACSYKNLKTIFDRGDDYGGFTLNDFYALYPLLEGVDAALDPSTITRHQALITARLTQGRCQVPAPDSTLTIGTLSQSLNCLLGSGKVSLLESLLLHTGLNPFISYQVARRENLVPAGHISRPISKRELAAVVFSVATEAKAEASEAPTQRCIRNLVISLSDNYMTVDQAAEVLASSNVRTMHAVLGL